MIPRAGLLAPDLPRTRQLARAIRSTSYDLETASDPGRLAAMLSARPDVVVVACPEADPADPFFQAYLQLSDPHWAEHSILVADLTDRQVTVDLLQRGLMRLLLAWSAPELPWRIIVSLAKMFGPDPFGVEKYLPWGVSIHQHILRSSEQKGAALAALESRLGEITTVRRLVQLTCAAADELLTNALYHAPVDREGRPLFGLLARDQAVVLPRERPIRFRYACDGRSFWVSVRDPFGSLTRGTLYENLFRASSRGEDQVVARGGGAGLGLYLLLTSFSDLVVNLVPSVGTEMIGAVRIDGSYRDHMKLPRSFGLFGPRAAAAQGSDR